MIKAVQKTLRFLKIGLVLIYLCFSVLYILLVLPTSRAHFGRPLNLFFYLLLTVNIVLTLLACIEELLMLSSLTVALSIISIITSYIIIDHNLIISLCLLVIFFMTFMLTLVLYLKPKVLVNQGPGECANDDHQRPESPQLPQSPCHDASSADSMPSLLQHLLPHHQQEQRALNHLLKSQGQLLHRDSLEEDFIRQFYLHLWRMKAAKVCLEQSLKLHSDDDQQSRNAYKTLLGTGSSSRPAGDTTAIHHYSHQQTGPKSSQLLVPSHQSINNLKPHTAVAEPLGHLWLPSTAPPSDLTLRHQ